MEDMINPAIVKDFAIPSIWNISRRDIQICLKKQIFYFRLIHSSLYYIIFKTLARMGLADKRLVAGFYANLAVETRTLPQKIACRDIISGRDRETSLEALMEESIDLPSWTQERIEWLTERFEDDVARLADDDRVSLIAP